MATERRSYQGGQSGVRLEKRADGSPVIVGYAAVYFRADDPGTEFELWPGVRERIRAGAFDNAIKECDVRALFNHSPDYVLGRMKSGTLRLSSDERGLRYEIDPPDTQVARDLVQSLSRGDISGSSFAFDVVAEEWRKEGGHELRELIELRLYDVGPVTFPAYVGTDAGVRSGIATADIKAAVERFRAAYAQRAKFDNDMLSLELEIIRGAC